MAREVRELGTEDAPAFRALRLRGFREEPRSFGSSFEEAASSPPDFARALLAREGRSPDDFVVGAFERGVLVGIAGFEREVRRKRAHRAKLWGMFVASEARGRGVARELCEALLRRARAVAGVERINLTVMAHNEPAIALYRALGFEVWGAERDAMRYDGAAFDELSMGLVLSASSAGAASREAGS